MGRLEEALEHDLKYSVEENQMNTEEEASAYKAKIRNTFKKGGPEAICSADRPTIFDFTGFERRL